MADDHQTQNVPDAEQLEDDFEELRQFLTAYRPATGDAAAWARVAPGAIELVLKAGKRRRLRVEKDIQTLGAVAAHLTERGRQVTLDEMLDDATLLTFETATAQSAPKTVANKRGILRRLQAAHRGLPWRSERRDPGERVQTLPTADDLTQLRRVLVAADGASGDDRAAAFKDAVAVARAQRRAGDATPPLVSAHWSQARAFAAAHGWDVTQRVLRAAVTHEVLADDAPLAVLVAQHGLTRRDLDLGLTTAAGLPEVPTDAHRDLLRGQS